MKYFNVKLCERLIVYSVIDTRVKSQPSRIVITAEDSYRADLRSDVCGLYYAPSDVS